MASKAVTCANCGYEFPPEVDTGAGQKARMGSFSGTCPICNREINPPEDPTRPGFRPAGKSPSGRGTQAARPPGGRKRKKKRRR